MDEEFQFKAEYVKVLERSHDSLMRVASLAPGLIDGHTHLSLSGDGRPYVEMFSESDEMMVLTGALNLYRHLGGLSFPDARRLDPHLKAMGIDVPWSAEKLSPVQQIAHRCARVLEWALDEEWCPGSRDWQPSLEKEIHSLIQKNVPTASIILAVLAARVFNGFRERMYSHTGSSAGTFVELGREDEKEYTVLVDAVTKSVGALRHRLHLTETSAGKAAVGKQSTTVLGMGPFPALSMRFWSNQFAAELDELLGSLRRSLEADQGGFREKLKIWKQVTPGDGHRGHYSPVIYDAYEMVLGELRTHWRKRGVVPTAMRLFESVGLRLTPYGAQHARQRKRKAAP